jgi:dolichol kinase
MAKRSNIILELLRKLFHLSGLFIVVLYTLLLNYFSSSVAILSITALLLLLLEIEYIRLEHKPKLATVFSALFRKHERNNIASSVFFVISCVICFAAFDYWIAVLAMFMTVFGDLFAAIIGKAFGKLRIWRKKTLVGTMSGLGANLLVGLLILPLSPIVFIPMAFIASSVEMITNKLDDNLTVPLFAGFAGQMIVKLLDLPLPPLDFSILGFF